MLLFKELMVKMARGKVEVSTKLSAMRSTAGLAYALSLLKGLLGTAFTDAKSLTVIATRHDDAFRHDIVLQALTPLFL
jgi:hypothetical protein